MMTMIAAGFLPVFSIIVLFPYIFTHTHIFYYTIVISKQLFIVYVEVKLK